MDLDLLVQQIINGITIGAIYSIVALGYTMVYGIIRLINFAHGAVFMLGAYLGLTLLAFLGGANPVIGVLPAMVVIIAFAAFCCGSVGYAMDRTVYRPLRRFRASALVPLIAALGLSLMLEIGVMLIWGKEFKVYPRIFPQWDLVIDRIVVSSFQIFMLITCVVMMIALHLFVNYSRLGRAMRASSLDQDAARLAGVDVDRIIALTFVVGSALAAVGGILFGMYYGSVNFRMGYLPGIKAFTSAVLGGVGNIPGAMLGGFIIGLVETFAAAYISTAWKDVIAFIILIAVIVIKPTGLLGERIAERT